jgi:DNA polymerase III epsilon subunit-like protein
MKFRSSLLPADEAILERLRRAGRGAPIRECAMKERYIAFDVETPNYANDRISAIGIADVEDGAIVDELYTLVNPETHFDALTSVSPESRRNWWRTNRHFPSVGRKSNH